VQVCGPNDRGRYRRKVSAPRVYVASSLGQRTGGPEAVSLLVHSLRQRGIDAYLIPMRNFRGKSNHPEYSNYESPMATRILDPDRDHFVLTEVSPIESRRELEQVADERVWMLWLSVNFSPIPEARYYSATERDCRFFPPGTQSALPDLWPYDDKAITSGPLRAFREARRRNRGRGPRQLAATAVEAASIAYARRTVRRSINFGTQSFYGQGFVRSYLGRDAFLLTDYPKPRPAVGKVTKIPNLVAYNGAKGRWKIDELRSRLPGVEFRPIQDMSRQEVFEALAESSLYVEIGHLPGRDRLPREAALLGTPTVMLARGAGFCWEDFPLGVNYRIPYTVDWADHMAPVITEVLDDPTRIQTTQEPFRSWVEGEPDRYQEAVDRWVERLTL